MPGVLPAPAPSVRHATIAYLPIIIVTIVMFCGASWQIFWTMTDAARYQCYALSFWLGGNATKVLPSSQCLFLHSALAELPFHTLPIEYPPLTLLLFSLGLLAPLSYYQLAFAIWMALVLVFTYWLLLHYAPRGAAPVFAFYMLLGAWATAEGHFDLVPAVLTLLCVIAAKRQRWSAAYVALAFAVLFKIYPILLFPVLFMAEQHAHQYLWQEEYRVSKARTLLSGIQWKNSFIFTAILLAVTSTFALLNFHSAVISQFSYFLRRPVQVESTGSTLLWLATHAGFPLQIISSYGSLNIISPLNGAVSLIGICAFIVGYTYTIWMQWQHKISLLQATIAILLVFVATGKVFSPQYLIWITPLLAYSGALDGLWILLWGSISALTTVIYAYFYTRTFNSLQIPFIPGFVETVTLRNICLIVVTLAYLFNWLHMRQGRGLIPYLQRSSRATPAKAIPLNNITKINHTLSV